MPDKVELTLEQNLRLEEFKVQHGPTWRNQLQNLWLTGDDIRQPQGALLREIKNLVYQGKVDIFT